jgi:hypothetical protein
VSIEPIARKAFLAAVVFFIADLNVARADDSCAALPPFPPFSSTASPEGCVCGAPLRNLDVTLSSGFEVLAACNLWRPQRESYADLLTERVSLDDTVNGWYLFGQILLRGSATLSGYVTYQPGDSGELWFSPSGEVVAPRGTAFGRAVAELKLSRAYLLASYSPDELDVPPDLRESACWTAQATIRVDDIWVLLGESDSDGAYPVKYTVVSVKDLRQCD